METTDDPQAPYPVAPPALSAELRAAELAAIRADEARLQAAYLHTGHSSTAPDRAQVLADRSWLLDEVARLQGENAALNIQVGPGNPFFEGMDKRRSQLQGDYYEMKQRAQAAEAEAAGLEQEAAQLRGMVAAAYEDALRLTAEAGRTDALLRHCRHELHEAGLIDDDTYARLLAPPNGND